MFFAPAAPGVVAVFILSLFFTGAPQARAYAVGSTGTAPTNGSGGYDVAGSLQNIISPFTNFINELKFNNNTTINTNGQGVPLPQPINMGPVLQDGVQNILTQWFGQFDNWFYGISGVHLSGIFYAILSVFSWALGLAKSVVDWLLGLFH